MVKTVVREHHYPPAVIDAFFVDGIDHHGIEFWYNDILDIIKQSESKKPKNRGNK